MRSAIHISATIDKELYKKVDELSEEEERSKSWLVSKALKSYVDEIEDIKIAYQRMTSPKKRLISSKELRKSLMYKVLYEHNVKKDLRLLPKKLIKQVLDGAPWVYPPMFCFAKQ